MCASGLRTDDFRILLPPSRPVKMFPPSRQRETEETLKRKCLRWPTSYVRDETTEETGERFWI